MEINLHNASIFVVLDNPIYQISGGDFINSFQSYYQF
jgi:hypothetical protein